MGVSVDRDESRAWLLVSVSIVGPGDKLWGHAWRRLRSLGGYFVDESRCVLPARTEVVQAVRRLLDEVRRGNGVGQLLQIRFRDRAAENRIIAEMNAAVDAEYSEVLDRLPAFFSELEYERKRGRVIYEEVEESEADLWRFRRWMSQIAARDYFGAPGGVEARAALRAAADELAAFEAEAMGLTAPERPSRAPDQAIWSGTRLALDAAEQPVNRVTGVGKPGSVPRHPPGPGT